MKYKFLKIAPSIRELVHEDTTFFLIVTDAVLSQSGSQEPSKNCTADIKISFARENVSTVFFVFYRLSESDRLSINLLVDHSIPNTSCSVFSVGSVDSEARFDFVGRLRISSQGSGTDSHLINKSLVLGNSAFANVEPILEVENNDVSVSHGSVIKSLSPSDIYYLSSRGLPFDSVRPVLERGFFIPHISRISDPRVRDKVLKNLGFGEEVFQ